MVKLGKGKDWFGWTRRKITNACEALVRLLVSGCVHWPWWWSRRLCSTLRWWRHSRWEWTSRRVQWRALPAENYWWNTCKSESNPFELSREPCIWRIKIQDLCFSSPESVGSVPPKRRKRNSGDAGDSKRGDQEDPVVFTKSYLSVKYHHHEGWNVCKTESTNQAFAVKIALCVAKMLKAILKSTQEIITKRVSANKAITTMVTWLQKVALPAESSAGSKQSSYLTGLLS